MNGPDLKRLRNALGLSVAKAARQCEVTQRTWCRWEAEKHIPEGALKLFRILNKDGIAHLPEDLKQLAAGQSAD